MKLPGGIISTEAGGSRRSKEHLLRAYKNKKPSQRAGKEIKLYANISTPSDISDVLANGAEGIGNFKTEFMYLNSSGLPGGRSAVSGL